MAIVAIGWRCRSLALGIVYVAVGGLVAFLVYIAITLGDSISGSALGLAITSALSDLLADVQGPLNAVSIVGGALVIAGVAQIVASIAGRLASRRAGQGPAQLVEPEVPRATIEDVPGPAG